MSYMNILLQNFCSISYSSNKKFLLKATFSFPHVNGTLESKKQRFTISAFMSWRPKSLVALLVNHFVVN